MNWTTMAGSGALVEHDGALLMIRQRRPHGVHWEIPSGYYEPGESFEEAAAREVLEETAIAVEVVELVCTMTWAREHDGRRNMLAFFSAVPADPSAAPRAQAEEAIEDARYVDPLTVLDEIHPLERPVVERWWATRTGGFHVDVKVSVSPDGTQAYEIRVS